MLYDYVSTHLPETRVEEIQNLIEKDLGFSSPAGFQAALKDTPMYSLNNKIGSTLARLSMIKLASGKYLSEHAGPCIALALGQPSMDVIAELLSHPFPMPYTRKESVLSSLEEFYGLRPFASALFGVGYDKGLHIQTVDDLMTKQVLREELSRLDRSGSTVIFIDGKERYFENISAKGSDIIRGTSQINDSPPSSGQIFIIRSSDRFLIARRFYGDSCSYILGPDVGTEVREFMLHFAKQTNTNLVVIERAGKSSSIAHFDYRVFMGVGDIPSRYLDGLPPEQRPLMTGLFASTRSDDQHIYMINDHDVQPVLQMYPRDKNVVSD